MPVCLSAWNVTGPSSVTGRPAYSTANWNMRPISRRLFGPPSRLRKTNPGSVQRLRRTAGGFQIRRSRTLSNHEYHEQAIARGEMVLAEPHRLDPPDHAVPEHPVHPRQDEAQDQEDDKGADEPLERIESHAPIVSDRLGSQNPERRHSLQEMASKLTGKRRSDDENTS